MAQLAEKQTGGKQVLWPVPGAELKAESPSPLKLLQDQEVWPADLG